MKAAVKVSRRSRNSQRTKQFFKPEQKEEILQLHKEGKKPKEIAQIFQTTARHIRDIVKSLNPNIASEFTEEEEILLIKLYNEGITKEWELKKLYFKNKMPYMVRNKIKTLINKGILTFIPPAAPVKVGKVESLDISFFQDNSQIPIFPEIDMEVDISNYFI